MPQETVFDQTFDCDYDPVKDADLFEHYAKISLILGGIPSGEGFDKITLKGKQRFRITVTEITD